MSPDDNASDADSGYRALWASVLQVAWSDAFGTNAGARAYERSEARDRFQRERLESGRKRTSPAGAETSQIDPKPTSRALAAPTTQFNAREIGMSTARVIAN
jgi:hypothetical protein